MRQMKGRRKKSREKWNESGRNTRKIKRKKWRGKVKGRENLKEKKRRWNPSKLI